MAAPSLITSLNFPSIIDVSNGSSWSLFSIGLKSGALGAGAHVRMTFDYISFGFDIGETGDFLNTFDDNTPDYASSSYEVFGGYPAGNYTVHTLYLWDDAGHGARYSAADLTAMGFKSSFTIIDTGAPAAPTIQIDNANGGLVEHQAHLSGSAGAFQEIKVTYLDSYGTHTLGRTTADAQGHWSLTSYELADDHYTQVVATATQPSTGNVSTYSKPLDFYVQKAPAAPTVHIASGSDGATDVAKPLIWGNATANADVSLYDGARLLATVHSDADGWWGLSPGQLASGAHHISAVVKDQFGRTSPSGTIDVKVASPATGISFTVGDFSNETAQALDVNKLQLVLDAVSALTSGVLDGTQEIVLKVAVKTLTDDRAIASAGSTVLHHAGDDAMPTVTNARLSLSASFAKQLNDADFLSNNNVAVLAHEMLHVLGFQSDPASIFHQLTGKVGDDTYFYGFHSRAINGSPVALSPDQAHLADQYDVIAPALQSYTSYFSDWNEGAPFSEVDLAMLTDLGYRNRDTVISVDHHRYLAGDGKAGHDTVAGIDGRDTLYIEGKSSGYAVKATATGYSAADSSGVNGTLKLSNIERIYFNDKAMALDVGANQIGGMAYRMYQAAFNRAPDSPGLGFWIDKMDRGFSLEAVARAFETSDEFLRLYGSQQSDVDYVTQLYANVLHRAPDIEGLNFWLNKMQSGYAREKVLVQFSESTENIAKLVGTIHDGFTYDYARA